MTMAGRGAGAVSSTMGSSGTSTVSGVATGNASDHDEDDAVPLICISDARKLCDEEERAMTVTEASDEDESSVACVPASGAAPAAVVIDAAVEDEELDGSGWKYFFKLRMEPKGP